MEQKHRKSDGRNQKGRGRGRGRGMMQNRQNFAAAQQWNIPNGMSANNDYVYHRNTNNERRTVISELPSAESSSTNRKFEEACAKIQESVQRFANITESEDTSDDNEEIETDNILKNVLCSYGDAATDDNLQRTYQFLLDTLNTGACVCLICIESVKRNESVWSCDGCYCIFHLFCIQKWSKDSIYHRTLTLGNESIQRSELTWCCPKCRKEYTQREQPRDYYCFCGKEKDPTVDLWLVPHSCGQKCKKKLEPFCGHECLLLCHPGPCPPCPKTVNVSCHCERQKPVVRRCSDRKWSCGTKCNKLLLCDQHKCSQPCHADDCETCPHQSKQNCLCGKESSLRPCASPQWQCKQVCNAELNCGFHYCQQVCHKGDCSECPRAASRHCPCGKTSMELPCTEDIPPCGDTCEKLLICKIHRCSQRCHFGSCDTCLQMRVKKCHCGLKEKSVPCSKEYFCETKCKIMRDCKRHACNRKCCDGNCPPCEQPCGRTLNCRNHKCNSRCHLGPCYPCPKTVDVTCNCGSTKFIVPCGREKITKPPKCRQLCKVPPNCNHEVRDPHKCHFGNCPPCKQICNKILDPCGHICHAVCHTAVLTIVMPSQKRAGPWVPIAKPHMEIQNKPCPGCLVPIPVTCLGNHETPEFPCSQVRPWSCGRKCGRLLICTNHTCLLECHNIDGAKSAYEAGNNCQICEKPCGLSRPIGCTHPCSKPCHPGPCPKCNQHVRLRCHCQLNLLYIICSDWTECDDKRKEEILSCQNRCPKELSCGHRCPQICHPGSCPTNEICKKKVSIRCSCKRIKRDFTCNTVTNNHILVECDEICIEIQEKERAAQLAEEERRKEEEEKKQQQELEEFLRKTEGKKRKPRKAREMEDKIPWWKAHWKKVVIIVGGIVISICINKVIQYTK